MHNGAKPSPCMNLARLKSEEVLGQVSEFCHLLNAMVGLAPPSKKIGLSIVECSPGILILHRIQTDYMLNIVMSK